MHGPSSQEYKTTSIHDVDPGAEHLADFTVDPLDGEGDEFGGVDGLSNLTDDANEFISQEAFFMAFCQAFNIAACIPPYLQSLSIDDSEQAQARGASDALYDICLETPAMHFLIQPGGVWFQRVAAISAFALPKAMGAAAEIRARRAKPVKQSPGQNETQKQEPANDKETPANGGIYDWAPA
jgi:hypothetical protein